MNVLYVVTQNVLAPELLEAEVTLERYFFGRNGASLDVLKL